MGVETRVSEIEAQGESANDAGRRLGVLAAALGTVTWGSAGVLASLAKLPSVALAGYRLWIGAALMLGVTTLCGQRPSSPVLREAIAPGVMFALSVVNHSSRSSS
jgi:hypothetical protein